MDEKSRTLTGECKRIEKYFSPLDSARIRADKFKTIFKSGLQGISKMAQPGSITIDGNPNVKIDYAAKINSGVTKVELKNFIKLMSRSCHAMN